MKKKILALALCLAALLVSPSQAAISKHTVKGAWSRVASVAGLDVGSIPLLFEKEKAPNAWVRFESSKRFSVHVTEGLMAILADSDEIAGILAHEVGHVRCGHYKRGVARNVGWQIVGSLLGKGNEVTQIAGAVGMKLAESGFSREQEVEADDYGMDLATKAGYSPWGLYNAMKKFKDHGFATQRSGFNSHPPTERRLRHLRERAEKIERGELVK
ncbi:MAG: M48 family metalloprotease [Fretibacterium sp.]|nr:M48 family metalloprotease [Fretibacterium sp.]